MTTKRHVLLAGSGPWPQEGPGQATGPAIRTRQFAEPLIRAGHEVSVLLFEDARRTPRIEGARQTAALPPDEVEDPAVVASVLDLADTDVVIGVGSMLPVHSAVELSRALGKPLWVDFFGDPLAEQHALRTRSGETDPLFRDHVWRLARMAMTAGDRFSTVSGPQRHALIGQLLMLGRMEGDDRALERIHTLPCAVPDSWTEAPPEFPWPDALANRGVRPGAPYVYFGGSWNTWLDETAMASAVRAALETAGDAWLVCRGIGDDAMSTAIRERFLGLLEPVKDRVIVLDDGAEEPLLAHAKASLCMDRAIPEAVLGSRNRLLAMIRFGARPVVTTLAELERELVEAGLADGIGSAEQAADSIVAAFGRTDDQRENDAAHGREWLRRVTFAETLRPLLEWIDEGAPRRPDKPGPDGLVESWARFPVENLGTPPPRKRWKIF